ncbi:hypothetical protein TNCV_1753581 [Trichonephila clavipes]|nr:hypothetical protein TNCV_1753581 [Trichonephila clavipes]
MVRKFEEWGVPAQVLFSSLDHGSLLTLRSNCRTNSQSQSELLTACFWCEFIAIVGITGVDNLVAAVCQMGAVVAQWSGYRIMAGMS